MSRPAEDGGSSYQASTDFEGYSHAQLLDMIENTDPTKITELAQRLDSISTKTEKIGTDLQAWEKEWLWGQGTSGLLKTRYKAAMRGLPACCVNVAKR
jgi:N-acetylmuramic acid 6-phosphate (MurNAc-6-P) etherase